MERFHDSGYGDELLPNGLVGGEMTTDVFLTCRELTVAPPNEKLSLADGRAPPWRRTPSAPERRRDAHPRIKGAKLLWHNETHKHIWDLAFVEDGRLVIIAGDEAKLEGRVLTVEKKRFHCLDVEGNTSALPFPGVYKEPSGISLCRRTGALAITETSPGSSTGIVTILRHLNNNNKWIYKTHVTERPAYRIALTSSDTAICAIRWEKLVKYKDAKPIWSRSISTTNDLIPYICVSPTGQIIVSTPSTNKVSVFSGEGRLLVVFPTLDVRRPAGVCTDGGGRVVVVDKTTHRVMHFTAWGRYIQTLVQTTQQPTSVDLYDDRYLAVGTHLDGLYLYELLWQ